MKTKTSKKAESSNSIKADVTGMLNFNIYEFVTPSDPITFLADDDKVAFVCSVMLGNGKAGCHRTDENGNEVRVNSMLMFDPKPDETIEAELGMKLDAFWELNKQKIKECFASFAYGNIEDRKTFDDAMEAITDVEKRKAFKAKHEDRNRSSMSQWVKGAWQYADRIKI